VYLPPGYRQGSGPYPTLLALSGLFGDGASFFFGEGDFNLATRMDRLILSYKVGKRRGRGRGKKEKDDR
jgi:hypothetical protein